jgi:hypothetical protein
MAAYRSGWLVPSAAHALIQLQRLTIGVFPPDSCWQFHLITAIPVAYLKLTGLL